jgi:hypothetical protein
MFPGSNPAICARCLTIWLTALGSSACAERMGGTTDNVPIFGSMSEQMGNGCHLTV